MVSSPCVRQVAAPAADLVQSHPKLARLRELVEQHFRDCGDTTRVMVFSQVRSADTAGVGSPSHLAARSGQVIVY